MGKYFRLLNISIIIFWLAFPSLAVANETGNQIEPLLLGLIILLLSPLIAGLYILRRIKKVEKAVEEDYAAEIKEIMENEVDHLETEDDGFEEPGKTKGEGSNQ